MYFTNLVQGLAKLAKVLNLYSNIHSHRLVFGIRMSIASQNIDVLLGQNLHHIF